MKRVRAVPSMPSFRTGWWLGLCLILSLLAAVYPARAQEPQAAPILTGPDLDLIAPPDLSSPRATLHSLRANVEQATDIFAKAYDEYWADPDLFASAEVEERVRVAELLLKRAMATLDLSQVPSVTREQTGLEVVLLLEEILDRLPAIDLATVPDAAQVRADGITAWTLPYTDLTIVKPETGPEAGHFVFSPQSIAAARDLYDKIASYGGRVQEGRDLYRFYTLTPGDLLPPKWVFLIERLPRWAKDEILLGHALWQWLGIVAALLVLFGAWWAVVRILRRRGEPVLVGRHFLHRLAPPLLLIGAALLAKWVIVEEINASGQVLLVASTVLEAVAYLATAWTAYLLSAGLGERIASAWRVDRASIDASLIRVAARVIGIAAAITIIFIGATDIGLPVYGIVAGLGVGGLALGLAARPTLENLIGGFTLYADRPVRVGDFCKFGDKLGTVEEIGLRSTRLRALDRTLITIPNAEFSNMVLVNFTRRDQTLFETTIGLRYETTEPQLHAILEGIRALLAADPDVNQDEVRVHLQEFGPYAVGIGIYARIKTTDRKVFLGIKERILFGIMKIIEDAGAEIAYLPQMTYELAERPAAAPAPAARPAAGAL